MKFSEIIWVVPEWWCIYLRYASLRLFVHLLILKPFVLVCGLWQTFASDGLERFSVLEGLERPPNKYPRRIYFSLS